MFQKLLSYIIPVRIWQGSGKDNTLLELLLYQGEWQLATDDALYSDGYKYRPLVLAFKYIRRQLAGVHKMLVLGAGIGSAVHVLHHMHFHPAATLVDHDRMILKLAEETLKARHGLDKVKLIHDDAESFLYNTTEQWDLIVVDVFSGRVVPPFVTTEAYMQQCRRSLAPGGIVVINYMVHSQPDWQAFKHLVESVFLRTDLLDHGINRILIATA